MNILRKIPIPLDYFIGIIIILAGLNQTYTYYEIMDYLEWTAGTIVGVISCTCLFFGGILVILLPRKSLRRIIWLVGLIIGINQLASGMDSIYLYSLYREFGYLYDTEVFVQFWFGIFRVGCGLAMILNSGLFAFRKLNSIYLIIISLVLTFSLDYLMLQYQLVYVDQMDEYFWNIVERYVPHILMLIFFAVLFLSDEISWYTSKESMNRALNRLHTAGPVFAISTITRDQLLQLVNCKGDISMRLNDGRFKCSLDVLPKDGYRTLVFYRSGDDSMAGALYLDIYQIQLSGTISTCSHVDMYGKDGLSIRMAVRETKAHNTKYHKMGKMLKKGMVPNFCFSLPNRSLYDLVEGVGRYEVRSIVPGIRGCELEICGTGDERVAMFYRNGNVIQSMELAAVVPLCEYGAYNKLYLYGKNGRVMVFRVRDN